MHECKYQQPPGMAGPSMSLHVYPNTKNILSSHPFYSVTSLVWCCDADVAMGAIEGFPIREPSVWCHRMVISCKSHGKPRQTVDLSPLTIHCLRETHHIKPSLQQAETHHIKPPFQQAKTVASNTSKSVADAKNGFYSIPIHPDDRHCTTTFIIPMGTNVIILLLKDLLLAKTIMPKGLMRYWVNIEVRWQYKYVEKWPWTQGAMIGNDRFYHSLWTEWNYP